MSRPDSPRPKPEGRQAIRQWCNEHADDIRAATTAYIAAWPNTWPELQIAQAIPKDVHSLVAGRLIANIIIFVAIDNDIAASELWRRLIAAGVMGSQS